MKKYKIIADPRVKQDLQDAMTFLKSRSKGLDARFLGEYKKSLKALVTNPFYEIRYNNIRCLPLHVFKYMIHFSVDEETKVVIINAVFSTYLNPKDNWL